ncbi:MAG: sulfide/dihydroorotate dehydrogenase-like FAD/NAD-binding protein [Clostridiaceae bacterium]|nr:sulfide/dihydroorotate dehydrogenase-like FAD/NAD-binding protein [Clostridiaceae bacterium]
MYKIVNKQDLNPTVSLLKIAAPEIARKAKPGQFIILRVDDEGERIPLTIADHDNETGTVTIVFQLVGKTTRQLSEMKEGDYLLDFVGPLGKATELDGYKKIAVIGGGLGSAIAWPQAKKLFHEGAHVDMICGFRNKDLIILEEEMKQSCTRLIITTDDGSNGRQGFVTDILKDLIDQGNEYDLVIAIGPLIMMKFVCKLTLEYKIKTIVSMNPVMVDGTGMCGGCRVTVGGETKFACVDGPDFDGHLVDFDEAMRRQQFYKKDEKEALDRHTCRLTGEERANG